MTIFINTDCKIGDHVIGHDERQQEVAGKVLNREEFADYIQLTIQCYSGLHYKAKVKKTIGIIK